MSATWSCPLPLRDHRRITIGHGGGGQLGADLIEHLFLPAFGEAARDARPLDAAVLEIDGRIAFTTDSYVVTPLEFPGGSIGELAVNGTVNDLAMAGARPVALSTAFVLEEGLELETLARIATAMGTAAAAAGVGLVTGDTKVVDAGRGDGIYITTAGVGAVGDGIDVRPERMAPGDKIVLSGPIGLHGMAVLSVREGVEFGTTMQSDTAPLHELVGSVQAAGIDIHTMRDLTRGGMAAGLCELAASAGVGVVFSQNAVPIPEAVAAACNLFGLDPLEVANEGVFVIVVHGDSAEAVVEILRGHQGGRHAVMIGEVTDQHPGIVVQRTRLGANRVIDRPMGEQLPRIC